MTITTYLASLLCGFSVFSGLILAATQIHRREARIFGWLLISAVIVLQLQHAWLFATETLPFGKLYIALLYLIAPSFYLFVRGQFAPVSKQHSFIPLLHLLPLIFAWLLPEHIAMPLAFLLGGAYLIWLVCVFLTISEQEQGESSFSREVILLISALALGLGVFVLGLSIPLLGTPLFHTLYAIGIGGIVFLVHWSLLWNPNLPDEVNEAVQQAYVKSTLQQVDNESKLAMLERLMNDDRIYQQPDLKLAGLAKQLDLSAHQLSELINTHRGVHFSRFLRNYRVDAAKTVLIAKPSLSVLDVSLQVGFSSQSAFYEAFRDITGTTPAKYRKINL